MNAIMERWIRTCRRELLDRTLIWNQQQLLHTTGQAAVTDWTSVGGNDWAVSSTSTARAVCLFAEQLPDQREFRVDVRSSDYPTGTPENRPLQNIGFVFARSSGICIIASQCSANRPFSTR